MNRFYTVNRSSNDGRHILRLASSCLLLIFISSCAATGEIVDQRTNKNYTIGMEKVASIGSPMIQHEDITILEDKRWVGIINSPDGWARRRYATPNSIKEELIYTGRVENTLRISYREYKENFARPAFYQELTYDVSQSDEIVFRNFVMSVRVANNRQIKFTVLAD